MFTPSRLLFFFVMLFSSLLSISSPSWLGVWLGLEVNLMSFIPLIMGCRLSVASESAMKYFLVQALSSLFFVFSLVMMLYWGSVYYVLGDISFIYLMFISLVIKLGGAPFHMWFPAVASGCSWGSNFLLMTWQKVAPFVVIYYIASYSHFFMGVVLFSSFVGCLGGLNQSSLRKLMAYSSINHLAWLLMSSLFGFNYFILYFGFYVITAGILMLLMSGLGYYFLSQVLLYSGTSFGSLYVFLGWLSFGGLPPFVGFMPKWVVLDLLCDSGMLAISFFLVVCSLFSLFYYARLTYVVLLQSGSFFMFPTMNMTQGWLLGGLVTFLMSGLLFMPTFLSFI